MKPRILDISKGQDERLDKALQAPAHVLVQVWCRSERGRSRRACNTFVGEVMQTTQGALWVAHVLGPDPFLVRMRELGRRTGARMSQEKLPNVERENGKEIWHAMPVFLDDAEDVVRGTCPRHGPFTIETAIIVNNVALPRDRPLEKASDAPVIEMRDGSARWQ